MQEECDSDIWDDTALIAAYDAAVGPLKVKIAQRTGDPSIVQSVAKEATSSACHKKKKNKKKKSKTAKKKQQVQDSRPSSTSWAVGDLCQALYTEDNQVYKARIVSIDSESRTCMVRYLGYGNEEEQSLEDLIPNWIVCSSVSCSETESETSQQSAPSMRNKRKTQSSSGAWSWPGFPTFERAGMPPPPPPPQLPFFPGHPCAGTFPMPPGPMGGSTSLPFPVIPPPPPPMPSDNASNENEALCSMLLAWYMSGYHTGYYQGLLHGRQHDPSGAMGPSR